MPKLDLKRLAKDVDILRQSRPVDLGPGGRRLTGAMAIVRDNLEALEALRANGSTWVDIAAGLAAQGVTQGNGDPITGKRLTALRASVKRQAAKRVEAQARRMGRPDLRRELASSHRLQLSPNPVSQPRLAPELQPRPVAAPGDTPLTEAEIRQLQVERHSHLFKKD